MVNTRVGDWKVIQTKKAAKTRASQGFRAGDFVYTAGVSGIDPKTREIPESVADQTRIAMTNIKAILAEEDADLDDVIKTIVYLTDVRDFKEMNDVYETYMQQPLPARSAVLVGLVNRKYKVEIEVIAYAPKS